MASIRFRGALAPIVRRLQADSGSEIAATPSRRPQWPWLAPSLTRQPGVVGTLPGLAGLKLPGPDIEQGFEVTPVEGLAAGQVEGDDIPPLCVLRYCCVDVVACT